MPTSSGSSSDHQVREARALGIEAELFKAADKLRGLAYFRDASVLDGTPADPRLADAVALVRSRRRGDGRWDLDWRPEGRTWFHMDDGPGRPSRWITLDALRVLAWWDAQVTP